MADASQGVITPEPVSTPEIVEQVTPEATAAEGGESKPVEKTFSQKELDEIFKKRLSKERRKRIEIETRYKVEQEMRQRPVQQPVTDGEPKREQFNDYEGFIEARAEWKADQRVNERLAKQSEDRQQQAHQDTERKAVEDFQKRSREAAKSIPDFEEVVSDSDAIVTKAMAEAIVSSEDGHLIVYHLAKNPDEAERIASLSPAAQAREIGKIEATLSKPAPKKPSGAPAPISPVGGKASATSAEPDPSNTKDWIDWRNRQVAARKRG
jgi:hypothetical protein